VVTNTITLISTTTPSNIHTQFVVVSLEEDVLTAVGAAGAAAGNKDSYPLTPTSDVGKEIESVPVRVGGVNCTPDSI
jgi:hypothetical protein